MCKTILKLRLYCHKENKHTVSIIQRQTFLFIIKVEPSNTKTVKGDEFYIHEEESMANYIGSTISIWHSSHQKVFHQWRGMVIPFENQIATYRSPYL
jgi:hypothetical protein